MKYKIIVCFLLVCIQFSFAGKTEGLKATGLKSEYMCNPIGIDVAPQFSWQIESDMRATKQTAYRIIVSSSLDLLNADQGDVWDSGIINSSQSAGIPYSGSSLQSRQRY